MGRFGLGMLVFLFVIAMAAPATADGLEDGYQNCGSTVAYTHVRFQDTGATKPPGISTSTWWFLSGWNIREKNGNYSGYWDAFGSPHLDTNATWAACRSYG